MTEPTPTVQGWNIGSIHIDPILDGDLGLVPDFMFPSVDAGLWQDNDALDENGLLSMPHGGYLVRDSNDSGRVVLVDLGFGPEFEVPAEAGRLYSTGKMIDGLASLGIDAEQVTDIVITHAHPDHVGWASVGDGPLFVNAAYWCHEADWQLFVTDRAFDFVADRLGPVASCLRAWQGSATVTDWLDLREAPGHTPGSAVGVVESLGDRAALIGDLAHHPLEVSNPDWAFSGDTDSPAAVRQRQRWFSDFAADDTVVLASHFPGMNAVRVRERDGQFVAVPVA